MSIANNFKKIWFQNLLTKPNNLWALRVVCSSICCLVISSSLFDLNYGLAASMGVVGAALAKDEVHLKGAFIASFRIAILFFVFSAISCLLASYIIPFGIFIVSTTFLLIILGGYKRKYESLAFRIILIICYTILVYDPDKNWYTIPILFASGSLIYMSSTLMMLYFSPFRLLKNELALGYRLLGKYVRKKSKFLPSTESNQEQLRNELALINIQLYSKTEQIEELIQDFLQYSSGSEKEELKEFIGLWNQLQTLQERVVSSHYTYDKISKLNVNPMLITGLGKTLNEISKACELLANSILNNITYKHPLELTWTINAVELLVQQQDEIHESIRFFYKNMIGINSILESPDYKNTNFTETYTNPIPLKKVLRSQHSKFRHAVRLSTCLLIGYVLINTFEIQQGFWVIMTSLIVCQQSYNATRQKFFRRVIGTVLGVILGIGLVYLIPSKFGQILILLASIFLFFKLIRVKYMYAAIFITIYVLAVYNVLYQTGVEMMIPRIIDTIIGSGLAYLSIRFLWAEWQYKNVKPMLLTAIEQNKQYLDVVMNLDVPMEEYLQYQRNAHKADNKLADLWRSMRYEPKSKRKLLRHARNLTYLNHSLLSYISAYGVHRRTLEFTDDDFEQKNLIDTILNNSIEGIHTQNTYINRTLKQTDNLFLNNIMNISKELEKSAFKINLSD